MSKQWEYNVVDVPYPIKNNRTLLDNLGADGWELVSVDDGLAYMKREKKAAEPQEPAFPAINDPWAAKAAERILSKTAAQAEVVQ